MAVTDVPDDSGSDPPLGDDSGLPPTPTNALPGYEFVGRCFDVLKIDPIDIKQGAADEQALDISKFVTLPAVPTIFVSPTGTIAKPAICDFLPMPGGNYEQVVCDNSSAFDLSSTFSTDVNFGIGDPAGLFSGSMSLSYSKAQGQKGSNQQVWTFTSETVSLFQLTIRDLTEVTLTDRVRRAISQLPTSPHGDFSDFLRKFGTHYASKVLLGGRMTQRISVSRQDYESFLETGVNVKADASATFEAVKVTAGGGVQKQASNTFRNASSLSVEKVTFTGGDPQTSPDMWAPTVKHLPGPIQVQLQPLSSLMTGAAFPDDHDLSARRSALEVATQNYLATQGRSVRQDVLAMGDVVRLVLVAPGHPRALAAGATFTSTTPYNADAATPDATQAWIVKAAGGDAAAPSALATQKLCLTAQGTQTHLDAAAGHNDDYAKGEGLVGLSPGATGTDKTTWLIATVNGVTRPGGELVDGDYVYVRTPWSGTGIGAGYLIGTIKAAAADQGVFAFGKRNQDGSIWSIQRVSKGG